MIDCTDLVHSMDVGSRLWGFVTTRGPHVTAPVLSHELHVPWVSQGATAQCRFTSYTGHGLGLA